MEMWLQVFIENTTHHFIACDISLQAFLAARNTAWAEKKMKTVQHVFYDSAWVPKCIYGNI